MPKKDFSQIAFDVMQRATGEKPTQQPKTEKQIRLGKAGAKGGAAKMAKLSDSERTELAKKANAARQAKEALASNEASAKAGQLNKVN